MARKSERQPKARTVRETGLSLLVFFAPNFNDLAPY